MDNDVWEYFIYTCQRILFFILLLAAMFGFFIGSCVNGQEHDGNLRGETLAEERARIDAQKTRFAYIPQKTNAIQFDGICRLTTSAGKQWSGVAISTTQILTVAHHDETGLVRAEFAEKEHGAFNRLGIQAKIIRSNKLADLSLLEYNCPQWAAVKVYPVKRLAPARVSIRGYVQSSPRNYLDKPLVTGSASADGYNLLEIKTEAISGMSGSGIFADGYVIGIQSCGGKESTFAADMDSIEAFLKE